ncbi:recombinase family protein [Cyanobacterium sp. uoEpiScrs1]|uniref:recombinase family protein n=1 Tax=Cyanobacterium sp. uoEpiScrs1 TaxID=2976343 RepID=UPI002269E5EA|nr:recombinase family protein [Cyanobacterium sp. uoEpiScrs1]
MDSKPLWIEGTTRSGKTTYLTKEFCYWINQKHDFLQTISMTDFVSQNLASSLLVLSANGDNCRELANKLSLSIQGSHPIICKTPLGFITKEVTLFWPILFEELTLKAQFPLLLRPETEQELALRLWQPYLEKTNAQRTKTSESRFVRQTLDLLQLTGASGIPIEDIPYILEQGFLKGDHYNNSLNNLESPLELDWQLREKLILKWQNWCLDKGLLTYGLVYTLYWRYLLPNPKYQQHLINRYQCIFADDVDDYPAITKSLFDCLLDSGVFGVFTYNYDGQIRLGLDADPKYLSKLASRCRVEVLHSPSGLAAKCGELLVKLTTDPSTRSNLPSCISSIQTISRADLLRKTAQLIIDLIKDNRANPEEIAVIAPGLDEIARYTLISIISGAGIPIQLLNEQRSLISYPIVRALLSLLGLVYPGLGRLVLTDDIAQMLTVLSQQTVDETKTSVSVIDPVRAGLISDYCYYIDPEYPKLLSIETFHGWDRLGSRAAKAYQAIRKWITDSQTLLKEKPLTIPVIILDQAIKHFVTTRRHIPYDQIAALRKLMETAQHFWEVDHRLYQENITPQSHRETLINFIQLLRRGTITANSQPVHYLGKTYGFVTLATIFQYRSLRHFHRWQFWLDTSSVLWEKGGASVLFGAPLFAREWTRRSLSTEDELKADKARLERILKDLLGRVEEKIILCHSDLNVKGTEQTGPLLALVNSSLEFI